MGAFLEAIRPGRGEDSRRIRGFDRGAVADGQGKHRRRDARLRGVPRHRRSVWRPRQARGMARGCQAGVCGHRRHRVGSYAPRRHLRRRAQQQRGSVEHGTGALTGARERDVRAGRDLRGGHARDGGVARGRRGGGVCLARGVIPLP